MGLLIPIMTILILLAIMLISQQTRLGARDAEPSEKPGLRSRLRDFTRF